MIAEQPVRVVLVGCGAVARLYYAPALRELEAAGVARVDALVDPDPGRLADLTTIFPAARGTPTMATVADDGLDLAIIASPPRYHAEQTIKALEAGLAVLCEKPMATDLDEARAMVQAAARAQRPLAIGLVRRFFPTTRTIRDLIHRDIMGKVTAVRVAEGGVFRWPAAMSTYFHRDSGGGLLLDIGVHVIDLLVWWLGLPESVSYEDDAMGGVEANCRIHMAFAGGVAAHVRLSRDWPLSNRCIVEGERGWMALEANEADSLQLGYDATPLVLGVRLHEPARPGRPPQLGRVAGDFHRSFLDQLVNVLAAVRGNAPLAVPGEEGLRSLEVIERCRRDRRLMAMPWLTDEEMRNAARLTGANCGMIPP
jgi:predicted dehydrogenase